MKIIAPLTNTKSYFCKHSFADVNAFSSVPASAAVQGPARSSVATKEDVDKKENKPAPEKTEEVYFSRSSGLPLKFLDTSAKSTPLLFSTWTI